MNEPKIVVIVSGGMDSITLLYLALHDAGKDPKNIKALSFNYGQKHKKELGKAHQICVNLGIEHHIIQLPIGEFLTSALTTKETKVPEGHYAQANMSQTVVPNRNMIMLSQAYAYATSIGFDKVYFGAHAGDHPIYPDCRLSFVIALNNALKVANEGYSKVYIAAPFINITKGQIVRIGRTLDVPYEDTWSCYKGENRPCGKCGTCVERTEAFLSNNIKDPAMTNEEWQKAVGYYQLAKKQYEQPK